MVLSLWPIFLSLASPTRKLVSQLKESGMNDFKAYVMAQMPPFEDEGDADEWLAENAELVNRDWYETWLAQRAANRGED
jgi:hypothetical protein